MSKKSCKSANQALHWTRKPVRFSWVIFLEYPRLTASAWRASELAVMIGLIGMAQAAPTQWKVEDGGNGHWYEAVLSPDIEWNDANQATLIRIFN